MKILLSNESSSFNQTLKDTKLTLEWNSKIGTGIYKLYNAIIGRTPMSFISRQKT